MTDETTAERKREIAKVLADVCQRIAEETGHTADPPTAERPLERLFPSEGGFIRIAYQEESPEGFVASVESSRRKAIKIPAITYAGPKTWSLTQTMGPAPKTKEVIEILILAVYRAFDIPQPPSAP